MKIIFYQILFIIYILGVVLAEANDGYITIDLERKKHEG